MIVFKLDILDGNPVEIVVKGVVDLERLRIFEREVDGAFNDRDRWLKIRKLMTHEQHGPNVGWTLGFVMPGEDPDNAIDDYDAQKDAA